MTHKLLSSLVALSVFCSTQISLRADIQSWDPDGATVGTSISGNWDTITPNWTATPDSGANTVWIQSSDANFGVNSSYTVTLTQPISAVNITLSGTNGTLTIAGSAANALSLAGSAIFNTGARSLTLSAPLTGAFDLTKSGTGTLTLSGANTYAGGTFLAGGSVAVGRDSVFSGGVITSGPLGIGAVTVNSASTLSASGGARILDYPITMNIGLTIAGSSALTFQNGGWSVIGGNRTLTINNTADTAIRGPMSDDGAARTLTKAGAGKLIMAVGESTASFLGGITSSAGTLAAGSNTPFPTNNNNQITVNSSTLDLNGYDIYLSRLGGNATGQVFLANKTLTAGNNASSAEFSGVISGTGGYVKVGTISQVLSGTNTFTGGITIKEGALYLSTNGLSGSAIALSAGPGTITIMGTGRIGANRAGGSFSIITNNIVLANAGPTAGLDPANGGTFILSGQVSGSGGFLRYSQGSGSAIIAGDNTFTGGVEIDARTLGIGHPHALGTGPLIIGNPISSPSTAIIIAPTTDLGGVNAITNSTSINQSFTIFATNDFELRAPIALANTPTVTSLGTSLVKFSGDISGPGNITKVGTNGLVLSGNNTYIGDTMVFGGTLFANNTAGSATSTGAVTIALDATLAGNGTVAGPVNNVFGGTVAPGSSNNIGRLTLLNGVDMSGGTNAWELGADKDNNTGVAGVDFDQLSITGGTLNLGGSSTLLLQFSGTSTFPSSTNAFWQSSHTWKVVALSGGATNSGSANANFSAIAGTNDITSGTFSTTVDPGTGSILLSWAPSGGTSNPPVIEGNISGAGTTNATIRWSASSGTTYEVQYKDHLTDPTWSILGTTTATGSTASITDTNNPPAPVRFYRVLVQ